MRSQGIRVDELDGKASALLDVFRSCLDYVWGVSAQGSLLKVFEIIAFMAAIMDLGLLFYMLLGFRSFF